MRLRKQKPVVDDGYVVPAADSTGERGTSREATARLERIHIGVGKEDHNQQQFRRDGWSIVKLLTKYCQWVINIKVWRLRSA